MSFGYLYYISVLSAIKVQKTTSTIIWTTKDIHSKYLNLLKDKVDIRILSVPDFPALLGKPDYFIGAHTKDYLAYRILYEEGGVCLDLDTISIGDITELLGNKDAVIPLHKEIEPDSITNWNSAVLVSKRKSPIFKEAMEIALKRLSQPEGFQWGSTGPLLISEIVSKNAENVFTPELMVCGGLINYNVRYIYEENDKIALDPKTKVIHLYAVASNREGNLFDNVTPSFVEKSNSLLARTIKSILKPTEWNPFYMDDNCLELDSI